MVLLDQHLYHSMSQQLVIAKVGWLVAVAQASKAVFSNKAQLKEQLS